MEDVISHEQECALARRTITPSDLAEWQNIAFDDASRFGDVRAFIGPTEAEAWPLKFKRLTFVDSRNPSANCKCFALSTDHKLLAASFESCELLVWRDNLLVQRLFYQGHTDHVSSLSFSPVDHALASGSIDTTVIIWNTRLGNHFMRLGGHDGPVRRIAHTPRGTLIATAVDNKSVKIWDASNGAFLHSFDVSDRINGLTFSPDDSRLLVQLVDSCVLYDVHTHTHIDGLHHGLATLFAGSMSHQGDRVVTGPGSSGQVKIWSAVTGEELLTIGHRRNLANPLIFSPDDTEVLASCYEDETVAAYDSWTGEPRRVYSISQRAFRMAYSPDAHYVALLARDGGLQVHDTKSGAFLAKFESGEQSRDNKEIRFSSDNQTVLTYFPRGLLALYNIRDVLRLR
ncbi:uncharacterized protein PHACADRAFT_85530 [Phanerochaete carnosa HHB-10118-sp]|uniref:Uncharacterized protein n=1 Tax=Phanerochaete carnosa (strain HHB-10118-sp) TaxID=650164 RepID=K5W4M6_PHACS|nr:uncharacterized protein PHACADRAFT_85530 [Phanerochaete carnosa HHB-10118-sp]EKM58828.1 hypothetical protein PHACADRAFT_85530 [Phanerochaete carnosa HHB-10118-sp]